MGLYENNNGSLNLLAGSTTYADAPVGAIYPYGGSTAPQGFLICNGAAISRTTYAELFGVIGTSFGAGDGSTTFNVPDLRNKTTFGVGNATAGLPSVGSTTNGAVPNITGSFLPGNTDVYTGIFGADGAFSPTSQGQANTISNINAQLKTTNHRASLDASRSSSLYKTTSSVIPASVGVNYIIKATTISLPSDFEAAVDEKIKEVTTPNLTALTAVTRNIANSQTYLNQTIFTIPADAKRVFFSIAASGNVGGYVELIKGIQGYARDFNNISETLVTWTNNNVVHISYIYNHAGEAKDITFQCRYLA